jgi:lipopolysaccharide export system permease protein
MKLLRRYYIKEFFKVLGVVVFGISLIFSLLDLVDKIDDFMAGRPSIFKLLEYALLNLPKYLYYLLPMSLLICSLFIFTLASRHKELVIIRATGGRLKRLFYPFVVLGIMFSLGAFFIGEFVVPDFAERSLEIRSEMMNKADKLTFKEGTLWLRGADGSFIRIELYIPDKKIAQGVSIFLTGDVSLKERIEAQDAEWVRDKGSKGTWLLRNVVVYDIEKGEVRKAAEMVYPYLEAPGFFSKRIKNVEEMGIGELYRYTKRLEAAGFRDTKLTVDLNSKVSYPFANFVMMLLGMSLSVMTGLGGGLFAAGLGILISIVYWLMYTLMLSMGYARIIPPVVATWIIPVVAGIIAFYMFRKIPE